MGSLESSSEASEPVSPSTGQVGRAAWSREPDFCALEAESRLVKVTDLR